MSDRVAQLEAENARLRAALEVFADDANWFDVCDTCASYRQPAWRGPKPESPEDFARAALATPTESAGPTDAEMLDWLERIGLWVAQSRCDHHLSLRDAIRAAMKAEGK